MKNSITILLACIATLALLNYCLPADPLPKLARLPLLAKDKSDCDCGPDCGCCDSHCKCALPLNEALGKARAKDKPLVIYVNARPRPVKDAIHCAVESLPNFNIRTGVVLAVPRDLPGGEVKYYEEATYNSTVPEARILESIRDWRSRRAQARARGFEAFPFFQPSPSPTFAGSAPGCAGGS